jgi:polyribonucleotide nucleotidyltransferase
LKILNKMKEAQPSTRLHLKESAPKAALVKFDPEKKPLLVGHGGEMVKFIEGLYDCEVDTDEDGIAYIYGRDEEQVLEAKLLVQDLVAVVKEGDVYVGEIIDVKDFGAIVKIARAQEALLHVSELSHDPAVLKKPLSEVLAVGQKFDVKVSLYDYILF